MGGDGWGGLYAFMYACMTEQNKRTGFERSCFFFVQRTLRYITSSGGKLPGLLALKGVYGVGYATCCDAGI